ncbi:MAG: reverse transcriptase N-terminal domain-containing protein, partial [Clostridia bacterium]|nr:reverse transcriptase N-terminal domain-containing protein [Clostridia bacterium]
MVIIISLVWNDIDWKGIHYRISKIQKRIAYATLSGNWKSVRRLQKMLINSYDGRLLAVLRVTSKKMKRTPGIDGKFWNTDEEKFEAVGQLRYKEYTPSPFKRIYVQKENDKTRLRPLSVPVIYDRAMQGLFLLAVDPVVETLADTHAYGFRKYRSSQDVIRDIVDTFRLNGGNQWILKADIHECFDHISHKWLLDHPPLNQKMLKPILKCGYMYRGKWFPTDEGVPQGGVLSPVFTTHALCGMEKILTDNYPDNNI